jgi:hypothetical protein
MASGNFRLDIAKVVTQPHLPSIPCIIFQRSSHPYAPEQHTQQIQQTRMGLSSIQA